MSADWEGGLSCSWQSFVISNNSGQLTWSACDLLASWLLQFWSTEYFDYENWKLFAILMGSVNGIGILCYVFKSFIVFKGSLRLSRILSFTMAFRLIHASLNNFFDRILVGRVLNRFMKDLSDVDNLLGYYLSWTLTMGTIAATSLAAAVYSSSLFMLIFIFLYLFLCFKIQRYYMKTSREVTRLKSASRTPMIQAFSEGVLGSCTIRTFDQKEYSLKNFCRQVDVFQVNCLISEALKRWLSVRLTLLSIFILIPSIVLNLVYSKLGPGIFALLMKYMFTMTQSMQEFLEYISDTENAMISYERCSNFGSIEPEEGYKKLEQTWNQMTNGEKVTRKLSFSWPATGAVIIKDLSLRYSSATRNIIDHLSLEIPHGIKLGVVGRTGSGKSSLLNALYRYVGQYEGAVLVDGVELKHLDLKVLRSNISVITQDPYLFNDSLRNNLDPLITRANNEIIKTLAEVGLWSKLKSMGGLAYKIEQGGSNFSQGERQLLCLARAMLFNKKLVLMDEATGSMDFETEEGIRRLIREKFENKTVVIVAHRLATVMQCDKVAVMEQGRLVEVGEPKKLLEDRASFFYSLVEAAKQNHDSPVSN